MDYRIYPKKNTNNFEIAALVLSILSVTCCFCFYLSLPFGSLAIIFAILSKGGNTHMSGLAKAGFIVGIIGLFLSLLLIVYSIVYFFLNFQSMEEFLQYYSNLSGIEYEELYEMIYGQ